MTKCSEVMTKNPVSCTPGDLVAKVAQVMKSENVGPVPIVDDAQAGRLVGMVTDRDLAVRIVAEGRDTKSTRAEEVMTRHIVTCRAGDAVQVALDAMSDNQLRRIPVVDEADRLLGIIAQADVATRVNQPEKTATVVKNISRPRA